MTIPPSAYLFIFFINYRNVPKRIGEIILFDISNGTLTVRLLQVHFCFCGRNLEGLGGSEAKHRGEDAEGCTDRRRRTSAVQLRQRGAGFRQFCVTREER